MTNLIKPRLLNTKEAAIYLSWSESYLKQARMTGNSKGPVFIKVGRSIRYTIEDLDAYINSLQKFSSLAEADTFFKQV